MMFAEANLAGIPWIAIAPLILAFVVGIVLCLAGRRVMRLAFTAVAFIAGAGAGWVLTQSIELPVSPWLVIVGLACVLAAVAALAYKLTIACVMAIVLGCAAPLALITAGEVGIYQLPTDDGTTATSTDESADDAENSSETIKIPDIEGLDLPPDVAEWLSDIAKTKAGEVLGLPNDPNSAAATDESAPPTVEPSALSPETQAQVDRAKEFVHDIYVRAKERWDGYPQSLRNNLMLSAAVGALLGLLLGALMPGMSASIASAGAGSAICLIAGSVLAAKLGAGESEWMPQTSTTWLVLWAVVAIIGLAIQWTTRPKPVDKSG